MGASAQQMKNLKTITKGLMAKLILSGFNINGSNGAIPQLINYLYQYRVDVMCLSETHLQPRHRLDIKNFITYRKDKTARSGGVAILIKNNIPHIHLDLPELNNLSPNVKTLAMKLSDDTIIISIYKHPKHSLTREEFDTILGLATK